MKLANLSEKQWNKIRAISLSILLPIFMVKVSFEPILLYEWVLMSLTLYAIWQVNYKFSDIWNKSNLIITICLITAIVIISYLLFAITVFHDTTHIRWHFIIQIIIAWMFFRIIQFGVSASEDRTKLQIEKQQMATENYRVQLQELRTKVDPHFLFNSLNTLRVMIRNGHKDSEKFVMSLSEFYRQTLKYNESPTVTVSQEMDVMNSYLFLMEARNSGGMDVEIDVDEKLMQYKVPTLSLQILLENCFKHNRMSAANPLHISIYTAENEYICVKNNIQPKITQTLRDTD